jgi:hypothetical protein
MRLRWTDAQRKRRAPARADIQRIYNGNNTLGRCGLVCKERDTLRKQHTELQAFDEQLRHYADQRIRLDLDDGVKVNYGKFGDLPAEVKDVTWGTEETEDAMMTIHEQTMTKIQQLPESLAQEVSDFIDFLLVKQDQKRWELWTHFNEALALAETDFGDYLQNLETYEERLARGDMQW